MNIKDGLLKILNHYSKDIDLSELQPSSELPAYIIDAMMCNNLGVRNDYFVIHYNIDLISMLRTIRIHYIKKDGNRFFKGYTFTAEEERSIVHEQSNETKPDRPTNQSTLTMDCA